MEIMQGFCVLFWKKILEAAPQKAIVAWFLYNKLTKKNKTKLVTAGKIKDELITEILRGIPIHGHTNVAKPAEIYIHQLNADTGYSQEDLPREIADKNRWLTVWFDDDEPV